MGVKGLLKPRAAGVLRLHEFVRFVFVPVLEHFYSEQRNKRKIKMKAFVELITAAFILNAPPMALLPLPHSGCNSSLWNFHFTLNINIKMFSMEHLSGL